MREMKWIKADGGRSGRILEIMLRIFIDIAQTQRVGLLGEGLSDIEVLTIMELAE